MSLQNFLGRIAAATELPYELIAYQRFLDSASSSWRNDDAYLFFEPRVRFSTESDDVLVALESLVIDSARARTSICHPPTRTTIELPSLDAATASRIVATLNQRRSLLGVQIASGSNRQQLDDFLHATFGKFVFAPSTLDRLESRISGTEIVRFVGSPYEIQRAYWSNMADCRDRILARLAELTQLDAWIEELRILHIVLLLGVDGRSFYRPQSPLGRRDARPGSFYTTATRTIQEAGMALIVDGPRVSAPLVGGRIYHELLCRSVDDEQAMEPARQICDANGIDWGRVCFGVARDDPTLAPWFCPPRPITRLHLDRLFLAFCSAVARNDERLGDNALADLHWQFVRLHPFRCANQSLSMNIVNALRVRAKLSSIPHLLLDQCALRVTREAYRRIFDRALRHWSTAVDDSLERWRLLAEKRQVLDRFVGRLGELDDITRARTFIERDPKGARLALLLD